MGGPGSGMGIRWNTHRTKGFVSQRKAISARMLVFKTMQQIPEQGVKIDLQGINTVVKPTGIEIPQGAGESAWTLRISFAQTKTNYGNCRYWLRCPSPKCQRRCGKLYLQRWSDGTSAFLCRKCLNLAYHSQNKTQMDRMIDKKWALIRKLGAEDSFIHTKPKWMHWKTFNRLKGQVEALDEAITFGGFVKFSVLPGFANSPIAEYFKPF